MNEPRNGEHGAWKLVRLWPVVVAITAVIGAVYVTTDNVSALQSVQASQWNRISENRKSVTELEKQTGVIEYRLKNMDESLREQKQDIKAILTEVRK